MRCSQLDLLYYSCFWKWRYVTMVSVVHFELIEDNWFINDYTFSSDRFRFLLSVVVLLLDGFFLDQFTAAFGLICVAKKLLTHSLWTCPVKWWRRYQKQNSNCRVTCESSVVIFEVYSNAVMFMSFSQVCCALIVLLSVGLLAHHHQAVNKHGTCT